MEQTLVLIKPDGVARGLTGEIINRIERRGLQVVALKMMQLSREMAEQHYSEHKGKAFFNGLIEFITSSPLVAMIVAGENAVQVVRTMMGATNPVNAAPGTIRGDFALTMGENVIHGSDSVASAEREIALFFTPAELCNHSRI